MRVLFFLVIVPLILYSEEKDWRFFQRDNKRRGFTPFKAYFAGFVSYSDSFWGTFPPGIGNVDNDPYMEIVAACTWEPKVMVYNNKAQIEWEYPLTYFVHGGGIPAIEDINNDGINDIIICWSGKLPSDPLRWRGEVYAINSATHQAFWYYEKNDFFFSSASVAEVDGDSLKEIVFGIGKPISSYPLIFIPYIYVLNSEDGSIYHVFDSVYVENTYYYYYNNVIGFPVGAIPVLADLNNDNIEDIVCVKYTSQGNYLTAIDIKNKIILWENHNYSAHRITIDDIDNDGINEIVTIWYINRGSDYRDTLFVRVFKGNNGELLWEYRFVGARERNEYPNGKDVFFPAIGNINNDPFKEIVIYSDIDSIQMYSTGNGTIFIFDKDGNILFKDTTIYSIYYNFCWAGYYTLHSYIAPSICDIDNDDTVDVVYTEDFRRIVAINGINYVRKMWEIYPKEECMEEKSFSSSYPLSFPCLQYGDLDDDPFLEIVTILIYETTPINYYSDLFIFDIYLNENEKSYKSYLKLKDKYVYSISGQRFLKEKLKFLPKGIYFSPYENKKYFIIRRER